MWRFRRSGLQVNFLVSEIHLGNIIVRLSVAGMEGMIVGQAAFLQDCSGLLRILCDGLVTTTDYNNE